MTKVLLVNGPNLNLLGKREPKIYGHTTLTDLEQQISQIFKKQHIELICFQSNHEGEILDFLQKHDDAKAVIINPGGLTHTSVILRDALTAYDIPFIEVHISNIYSREDFRKHSLLSGVSAGFISGFGVLGYKLATQALLEIINKA
ncbi:MAG: type II 3-dehydroquinate dehydratase [SAR324 cluster bacterium]|nr:type II 3-dehydroquinate dehydratase [SAR324 cluster bacterium]